jgi:hypothetical protein
MRPSSQAIAGASGSPELSTKNPNSAMLATPIARGGPNRSATCQMTSKTVRSTAGVSYSARLPGTVSWGRPGGLPRGACRHRRRRTLHLGRADVQQRQDPR